MDTRVLLDEFQATWHEMKQAMDDSRERNKVAIAQMNARLDQLETAQRRLPLGGLNNSYDPASPPKRATRLFFKAVAAGGPSGLRDPNERSEAERLVRDIETKATGPGASKALVLGDDTLGGFLAPSDFVSEVVKGVQLISPLRSIARVRPTAYRNVQVPVRSGVFAAQWVGESTTRTETTGLTYSLEDITPNEMFALVLVSRQDLEDSAFDLAGEIASEASEQFAKAEGLAFVKGDGVKKPEGYMVNASVATDPMGTGGASAITGDGLINHLYSLKSAYARNATFVLNRKTLGAIRQLKDGTTSVYLWQPTLAPGAPNTILGVPYTEMPDMDDVSGNAYPVAVGDFSRGYLIVDRIDLSVQRLEERYAEQGQVGFLIRKRVGGQMILPEAVRKLKVATS